MQGGRNAALASVIAALQQAFLLLPWPVRAASALSLAKVSRFLEKQARIISVYLQFCCLRCTWQGLVLGGQCLDAAAEGEQALPTGFMREA